MEDLLEKIERSKFVIFSAPTGWGKTATALWLLKRVKEEKGISPPLAFFVTRTVGQMWSCIRDASKVGLRAVPYLSKVKYCRRIKPLPFSDEIEEEVVKCGRCPLRSSRRRAREISKRLLSGEIGSFEEFAGSCLLEGICPHSVSDALVKMKEFDVLACTYTSRIHVLSPFGLPLQVLDEAHNLVKIVLEEKAESVSEGAITFVASRLEKMGEWAKELVSSLRELLSFILPLEEGRIYEGDLFDSFDVFLPSEVPLPEKLLEDKDALTVASLANSILARVRRWKFISEADGGFFVVSRKPKAGKAITRYCGNVALPSLYGPRNLLMSATPIVEEEAEALGFKDVGVVSVLERFGSVRIRGRELSLKLGLTTRFRERTPRVLEAYGKALEAIVREGGKALVVFPSYELVKSVAEYVTGLNVFVERRGTDPKAARDALLSGAQAVFAVHGGKLVEGVEFLDRDGRNIIRSVVLVGVPYPPPDSVWTVFWGRREGENIWRLFLVDVWRKIRQAVGRGLRGAGDTVDIWLLDIRYWRGSARYITRLLREEFGDG